MTKHPRARTFAPTLSREPAAPWMWCTSVALALFIGLPPTGHTSEANYARSAKPAPAASKPSASQAAASKPGTGATVTTESGEPVVDLKKAIREQMMDKSNLMLVIKDKPAPRPGNSKTAPSPSTHSNAKTPLETKPLAAPAVARRVVNLHSPAVAKPRKSRSALQAHAAAMAGHTPGEDVHWSYSGEGGPQAWGKLKPEFNVCAIGKRQSPINIEDNYTLQGPAEPLQFNYQPSSGSVVNNGHTIQVDVHGDNTLTVRGSVYRLVQFHFHTPSEEQVNFRSFAMVAHLVHRNAEGQLAVVAVLLDLGVANTLVNTVWTYMPLDTQDRVRLPEGLLNMNELLPKDQRYYQFIGSLTTPPCTEGVLWMVMKTPTQISREQLKLFQQLYPNNARPVQPINGRPVRNAQ